VLLLMASSFSIALPAQGVAQVVYNDLRSRQQRIAEITEMIHVASLLHDDVLDHSDTRRGIGSLNYVMGNKLAVLAGDFLLARASVALASLRNTEVVELLSQVLEHLVTGEFMQLSTDSQEVARLVCLGSSGFVLVLYYHSPIQLSCWAAWMAISLHIVLS
jgi:geranyl diphosphate synthase